MFVDLSFCFLTLLKSFSDSFCNSVLRSIYGFKNGDCLDSNTLGLLFSLILTLNKVLSFDNGVCIFCFITWIRFYQGKIIIIYGLQLIFRQCFFCYFYFFKMRKDNHYLNYVIHQNTQDQLVRNILLNHQQNNCLD